jgi:hypothetical protein
MFKRLAVGILLVALLPVPAFAQSSRSLRSSIKSAAAATAAKAVSAGQAQRPAARGRGPSKTPGFVLVGIGGLLMLLAVASPSASCSETTTTFSCGTGPNKGLMFAGLGAAGFGTFLIVKK